MAVEEPPFHLRLREGAFEVRDYPALTVAEVTVDGDQGAAAGKGFRLLADYIFGGNVRRQSIAMTAPVTQTPSGAPMASVVLSNQAADLWVVRFTMPRTYRLETLPQPHDGRVRLRVVPPARIAVLRFSGVATKASVAAKTEVLEDWIRAHHWRTAGPVSLSQYDPPWTLWFLRRNEVTAPIPA